MGVSGRIENFSIFNTDIANRDGRNRPKIRPEGAWMRGSADRPLCLDMESLRMFVAVIKKGSHSKRQRP
jgi:hypothetical protein